MWNFFSSNPIFKDESSENLLYFILNESTTGFHVSVDEYKRHHRLARGEYLIETECFWLRQCAKQVQQRNT